MARRRTGHRLLWLRATGSTIISQIIDTYVVGFIGLYVPFWLKQRWPETFASAGGISFRNYIEAQTAGYVFKLVIAVGIVCIGLLVLAFGLITVSLAYRLENQRLTQAYEELRAVLLDG